LSITNELVFNKKVAAFSFFVLLVVPARTERYVRAGFVSPPQADLVAQIETQTLRQV